MSLGLGVNEVHKLDFKRVVSFHGLTNKHALGACHRWGKQAGEIFFLGREQNKLVAFGRVEISALHDRLLRKGGGRYRRSRCIWPISPF